jgi:hypothetical protein
MQNKMLSEGGYTIHRGKLVDQFREITAVEEQK